MGIRESASQPTIPTRGRPVRFTGDLSLPRVPSHRAPLWLARSLFVLAIVSVLAGQASLVSGRDGIGPLLLYAIGGASGMASAAIATRLRHSPGRGDGQPGAPSRLTAAATVLPLLAATCGVATVTGQAEYVLALALWLLTIVVALVVSSRFTLASSEKTPAQIWAIVRRSVLTREFGGVVALTFAGAILRVIGLASIPGGIHGDETGEALIALDVLAGRGPNPFGSAFLGDRAMHFWAQAPLLAIFGQTAAGMRAFTAICGIATLPAFYVLARVILGVRPAFISLILLTTSGLHIHFSRLALNIGEIPLLYCLAVTAFFLGRRTLSSFWWLLCGIFAGLAVYASFGGLLVLPLIAVLFVGLAVEWRRRLGVWLDGLAYAAFGTMLALGPLWAYQLGRNDTYTQHIAGRFIGASGNSQHVSAAFGTSDLLSILLQQTGRTARFLLSQGEGGAFAGFTGLSLAPLALAPFCVLGVFLIAKRLNRLVEFGVLAWLASVLLAGVLTIDAPQAHRLLPALPPLLIAASYALDWIVETSSRLFGSGIRSGVIACAFAVALAGGGYDAGRYFVVTSRVAPWELVTRIGQFFGSFGSDFRGVLLGSPNLYFDHSNVRFLAPRMQGGDLFNPGSRLPLPELGGVGYAFAISDEMRDYATLVRSYYPTARSDSHLAFGSGKDLFRSVVVPRDDLGVRPGLIADYGSTSRTETDLGNLGGGARSYPSDVRWHGSVFVERPGDYLVGASTADARVALDEIDVKATMKTPLAGGWHSIEARARLEDERTRLALRWGLAEEPMSVVPKAQTDSRQLAGNLRYRLTDRDGRILLGSASTIGFRNLNDLFRVALPARAIWDGSLLVDCPGEHSFRLVADGRARLLVDGAVVALTPEPGGLQSADVKTVLRFGEHDLSLEYEWQQGSGWVEVFQTTPCTPRSAILPDHFVPLGARR